MKTDQKAKALAGIDLGGTFVRVGILDTHKTELLAMNQSPLADHPGPDAGIKLIISLVEKAIAKSGRERLDGIGIGSTGPVDPQRGLVQNPYTLPGWENVDIFSPLIEHFGVPVALENDADAAALGEFWLGAGQNVSRLYAVTVGTGIGTAFIQNGDIFRGLDGTHPEGGHQIIDPAGPACFCGANGCWESLASGTAIARFAREQALAQPTAHLIAMAGGDPSRIDARLVAEAAQQGDPLATRIMQQAASDFSLGLVNVIHLFVPEVIVLSGGVMKSIDFYMPVIERAIADHNTMVPAGRVRILPARLGYLAGTIGAAYTVLPKLNHHQA